MPGVPRDHVLPGRVLHEDDDFLTLEVGKHDAVTFHLQQDPETGETIGGDRFLTVVFVHAVDGGMETWLPWQASDDES
jgi:hypothetical protein